ncbi:hypothetical protein [Streptomyces sp. NPDC058441]|uniref:hypothetical protein n=1 Tax=Streptomyces sp. NPDC058441 TaxID=3346502 RepID=UPI0036566875
MAEEGGAVVTAIELWWPGAGRVSSTRVLLDEDEVFTTSPPRSSSRAPSGAAGASTRRSPSTR